MYGLYHVNTQTGEKVLWDDPIGHNLPEAEAKSRAFSARISRGRAAAYWNVWTVEAHPMP